MTATAVVKARTGIRMESLSAEDSGEWMAAAAVAASLGGSGSEAGGDVDSCRDVNLTAIRDSFIYFDYPHVNATFASSLTNSQLLKIAVTSFVVLVALIGNLGIVIAVAFNRSLRTTINVYLVNLAVADLLICTFCMSVDLISNLTEPVYVLGPIVCKMNAFCQSKCLLRSKRCLLFSLAPRIASGVSVDSQPSPSFSAALSLPPLQAHASLPVSTAAICHWSATPGAVVQ